MAGILSDQDAARVREFISRTTPTIHPAVVAACWRVVWLPRDKGRKGAK